MIAPAHDAALRAQRRQAVRRHPTLTGLDAVEVHGVDEVPALLLHFVPPAPEVEKAAVPADLTAANVRIAATLEGATPLSVASVGAPAGAELVVTLSPEEVAAATAPSYVLTLVDLAAVDPFFDAATFSFEVDEPRPFDCAGAPPAAGEELPAPEIDYLARDFASFRRLMLDRLSLLVPGWRQLNPIDWPAAVVEALAAAADRVSYFQDAVATEAYLGTARRRTSVRRHARLLDYRLHEGCTARTWVAFTVAEPVSLPSGAPLVTRLEGSPPPRIPPESPAAVRGLAGGFEVFETLHPAHLVPARNELRFYRWGADERWLEAGATAATLVAPAAAAPAVGDVLIFEEKRGPSTGEEADADPEHRHAVRLTRVRRSSDPLAGAEVLEIAWHAGDALPFPLCTAAVARGRGIADVAVARGNVVLAAHGRTVKDEPLGGAAAPADRPFRPRLERRGLAHSVPWDDALARSRPAADALVQDPRAALPEIRLEGTETREIWTPRRDLLAADRFARELVVEMEDDGTARLRFGDGVRGRRPSPGVCLSAHYRIGNGAAGNVGRDAIAHLVAADGIADGVVGVRNPLAARGGIDPEPLARVRLDAPQAFRTPERCVTAGDYAAAVRRHPEVARAAAERRWVGSWPVVRVAVQRRDGREVDAAFSAELRSWLDRFRLAGADLRVCGPRYVPVEIVLIVDVGRDHFPSTVRQALTETFSNAELAGGRRGFFHRVHLGFGETVYLSRVVAAAMAVPGVARVTAPVFRGLGRPPGEELGKGRIEVAALEIARLDNDPEAPENGTLKLTMRGGR